MATHKQRVFKFDLRAKKITEVGKGAIGVIMLTSKPYSVEDSASYLATAPGVYGGNLKYVLRRAEAPLEKPLATGPSIASAELRIASGKYNTWPQDRFTAQGPAVISATLRIASGKYNTWPQDRFTAQGPAVASAELKRILVHNTTWPQDRFGAQGPAIASAQLIPKP